MPASPRARAVSLADLLEQLSRDELRQICRDHQIDDSGRAKAEILARLLDPPTAGGTERLASELARPHGKPNQLSLLDQPAAKLAARSVSTTATPATPPELRSFKSFSEIASFIWSVADLLRGDYKLFDNDEMLGFFRTYMRKQIYEQLRAA